jgi:hypothetical protein
MIFNAESFAKLVALINKRGTQVDGLIQEAVVIAAEQATTHGNINPINLLYTGLPNGARRASFVAWCELFANVTFMSTDKAFAHDAGRGYKWTPDHSKLAMNTKWHEARKESIRSDKDAVEEVDAFIKRMMVLAKEGRLANVELVNDLAKAKAKWHGAMLDATLGIKSAE